MWGWARSPTPRGKSPHPRRLFSAEDTRVFLGFWNISVFGGQPELCHHTRRLLTHPWGGPKLGTGQATASAPFPGSADRAPAPCQAPGPPEASPAWAHTHGKGLGGGRGAAGHSAGRSHSRDPWLQRPGRRAPDRVGSTHPTASLDALMWLGLVPHPLGVLGSCWELTRAGPPQGPDPW